jgi:hypothetical protein
MAKGKRLENKHQNENLEEERLRFDDQAGRGIGKLGLLQCLKEVEFTPEQIKGICCDSFFAAENVNQTVSPRLVWNVGGGVYGRNKVQFPFSKKQYGECKSF